MTTTQHKPVFVHLLHGRDNPDQDMETWGFVGPVLGPFDCIHVTYMTHIRCIATNHDELELRFHEDMLVYEGKYYGDFEICGGHDLP